MRLTEAERAYRRGALQAVQFVLANLRPSGQVARASAAWLLSLWEAELIRERDSEDVRLLGHYLDEIRIRVNGGTRDATGRPAR